MRGKKPKRLRRKASCRSDAIRQDAVTAQLVVQAPRGQLAAAPAQADTEPYEGLAGSRTRLVHKVPTIATSYDPKTYDLLGESRGDTRE